MKVIQLTHGYITTVDDADFERATYRCAGIGAWVPLIAPKSHTVYAYRAFRKPDGKWGTQMLHRFLLGVTDRKVHVDHEDGNGLNNQRHNLRTATPSQNAANSRRRSDKTIAKSKGVCWSKVSSKWQAKIMVNNKSIHLGLFADEKDAAAAYWEAAQKHFGQFARKNSKKKMR